ncbi:MAG: hypothetical protein QXP97_03560 [Desulfurococcus sp.]|jgi:tRNA (guanine37-N1)-methyltransferase|uniref:hypothetical protein n=1 Tax=Desulfurococcus sp. TaxID=51678 RepID=UPI00315ECB6D
MVENIKLNKVEDVVEPILGDAKDLVLNRLRSSATRVLMPHPELALDYLGYAMEDLQNRTGWVHVYLYVHTDRGEHWRGKSRRILESKLAELSIRTCEIRNIRKVRNVGPRMHQVVLDVLVQSS